MADSETVTVRNDCPSNITYDLDIPGGEVYPAIEPGQEVTITLPAGVVLGDFWTRTDGKPAEAFTPPQAFTPPEEPAPDHEEVPA